MQKEPNSQPNEREVALFLNNKSQAVRIPRDLEFLHCDKVLIRREGDSIIIRPAKPDWRHFGEGLEPAEDFMLDRPDLLEGRVQFDD